MPLVKRPASLGLPPEPVRSFDTLIAGLHAADAETRRGAARGLGEHPAAARHLAFAVAAETDESVRETMFTALIRIGSADAADGLVPLLQSEDVALRNGAVEALKTMPDAVAERVAAMFTGPTDVRIFVVEILGALAHPQSPRLLIEILDAEDEVNVCAAAVNALVECGDRTAIRPLQRLLERFPDEPFLAFAVRTALARIANV